ncbi:MAG: hypothetical protein PHY23_05320, partial [Oscillospiraceae bacterium]|nr:hypothetical protein [Oscillospiraceae bacterium]
PQYCCTKCNTRLQSGNTSYAPIRWKFCLECGEQIEWDKAEAVKWEEKDCDICGGWLIRRHPAGFMYASSDYIGIDTCRSRMTEYCSTTNCVGCKRGIYPNCNWLSLKETDNEEKG